MKNTQFLSVKEVSTDLNVSEQYVRSLIRQGKIPAERVGRDWIVSADSMDAYKSKNELVKESIPDHGRRSMKRHKIKALSFFSGAMGMDIGLGKADIEVLLASEIDLACRKTIDANRPDIALIGDIRDYSADQIRSVAGLTKNDDIDLIVGGPPCQAFSTAGKRQGFEDERGNVFLTFIDRIIELRPKFAVIENVRGLLSAPLKHRPHLQRGAGFSQLTSEEERGGALMYILSLLKKAGYGISFNLYNSANFGTPQKRERVIIICSRDGHKLPYLTPTHSETGAYGLPKWRTFRDAVKGLSKKEHNFVKFPEKRLRFYRMLKPGQYWKDLPLELQKEALGASFYAGGGKTGFLRRLAWNAPSPTLVTHPAMPATDLAHPEEDRPLSIQEYKRIQEFPDTWSIEGTLVDQYRQLGNAVPISVGFAIGKHILSHMQGKKIKTYPEFSYSRYIYSDDVSWVEQCKRKNVECYQLPLQFNGLSEDV